MLSHLAGGNSVYLIGFNSSDVELVFCKYGKEGGCLRFVWKENSFDTCQITAETVLSSNGDRWLSNVSQNISVDQEFKNHPTWVFRTLHGDKGDLWSSVGGKTGYRCYGLVREAMSDKFNSEDISDYILYSNYDIKDINDNVIFENTEKLKFNLHVEPSEQTTNVPVKIFTDWYSLEDFSDILVKYSYDSEKWENCDWERYMNPSSGQEESLWRFKLDVYNNDTYYFKFFDLRDNREEYITVVIKNIVYTQDNPRKLY